MNRLISDFANANPGITLEYVRMASLPLMSRLDQERKTSADGADVQITSELGWAEDRAKEGALSALIGPNSTAWPKAYMTRGLVPTLAFDPIGIAYNTNLVKTPIANYKDLLRPEYRGQIGVLDLVATSVIAFYDWLEMTEGSGYLQKLAAQNTRVFASTPIGGQNVAAGEMPITTFVNASTVLPLIAAGAPMKLVFPRPAFALTYIGSTLGWAKRPNAAQVFMDYIMSPRGQTVWTGTGEAASPLPSTPGSLDASSVNPYNQSRYTPEVARNYRVKWEAMYKK